MELNTQKTTQSTQISMAGLVIDIRDAIVCVCVFHGVVDNAVTVCTVVSIVLDGALSKVRIRTMYDKSCCVIVFCCHYHLPSLGRGASSSS